MCEGEGCEGVRDSGGRTGLTSLVCVSIFCDRLSNPASAVT